LIRQPRPSTRQLPRTLAPRRHRDSDRAAENGLDLLVCGATEEGAHGFPRLAACAEDPQIARDLPRVLLFAAAVSAPSGSRRASSRADAPVLRAPRAPLGARHPGRSREHACSRRRGARRHGWLPLLSTRRPSTRSALKVVRPIADRHCEHRRWHARRVQADDLRRVEHLGTEQPKVV
jgi:hypothetical protein